MSNQNSLDFSIGYDKNNMATYYSYDNKPYTIYFPKKWVKNHIEGTGPKMCENCDYHGSLNGVFVGYCSNCAIYIYEGQRGRGMDMGNETDIKKIKEMLDFLEVEETSDDYFETKYPSIFDTYLKNVSPEQIGYHSLVEKSDTCIIDFQNDENDKCPSNCDDYYCDDEYSIGAYDNLDGSKERDNFIEFGVSRDDYFYGSSYDGGYDSY